MKSNYNMQVSTNPATRTLLDLAKQLRQEREREKKHAKQVQELRLEVVDVKDLLTCICCVFPRIFSFSVCQNFRPGFCVVEIEHVPLNSGIFRVSGAYSPDFPLWVYHC